MYLNSNDIVLFSGDSITDGNRGRKMDCNHIMGHGYQFILAAKAAYENYERRPKFINKGYSGATTANLLETWQEDVIDNAPTVLSILVGTNDGLFGFLNGLSLKEVEGTYEKNLTRMIELTRRALPHTKIIVCEPFYFPLSKDDLSYRYTPHVECEVDYGRPDRDETQEAMDYKSAAIQLTRSAARRVAESSAEVFVPLYDKFSEKIAGSKTEYFMWDGTHPSIAGHMLIAEEWEKAVEKANIF